MAAVATTSPKDPIVRAATTAAMVVPPRWNSRVSSRMTLR